MRILIAVHGFPPTHYAGAERAAERIVKWLVSAGVEVEVFAIEKLDSPGFRMETGHENGYTIHRLYYHVHHGEIPFRNSYDYAPIGESLRQVLSAHHFDLLHMVSGYLLGAPVIRTAHEFHVPVVVTLTEYWFLCTRLNLLQSNGKLCVGPESVEKCARCMLEDKRRYHFLAQTVPGLANAFWQVAKNSAQFRDEVEMIGRRQHILREVLDTADLVISPSRFLIHKFAEFGFDTRRYVLVRHGLSSSGAARPTAARTVGEPLRLGYLGQLKQHKGLDLVVEAVIRLLDEGKAVTLDVWGPEHEDPAYVARLKRRAAAYPGIRWNGRYQSSQLRDILAGFDALVVPSRWYENSPTVILEAYQVGLPVVATNLGGMAELVEHEKSGLVFELNNAADLQKQLTRLVDEPDLLERLQAGIPCVRTAAEEVEEIFAHYQTLLRQPG